MKTVQFKYFDTLISSDGRNNTEIASRIAHVEMDFHRIKQVHTNETHFHPHRKESPGLLC